MCINNPVTNSHMERTKVYKTLVVCWHLVPITYSTLQQKFVFLQKQSKIMVYVALASCLLKPYQGLLVLFVVFFFFSLMQNLFSDSDNTEEKDTEVKEESSGKYATVTKAVSMYTAAWRCLLYSSPNSRSTVSSANIRVHGANKKGSITVP